MERRFRPTAALWVVFAATAIVRIGYGGIMPVLPVYAEQHGLSTFMIAVMTNAFLISNTVFQSLAGDWSDRWGRRTALHRRRRALPDRRRPVVLCAAACA